MHRFRDISKNVFLIQQIFTCKQYGAHRKRKKNKGKGKSKERGRWKLKKSWSHGRTDGQTLRWFYTLSNAMHCIGQTRIGILSTHNLVCRKFATSCPAYFFHTRRGWSALRPHRIAASAPLHFCRITSAVGLCPAAMFDCDKTRKHSPNLKKSTTGQNIKWRSGREEKVIWYKCTKH